MKFHDWAKIEREQMNPEFARQVIHGDEMTVARVYLKKGSKVPRHSHANEQIMVLLEGKLTFVFDDREVVVEPGQILQIPGNEPHGVETLEDSIALDLFSPFARIGFAGTTPTCGKDNDFDALFTHPFTAGRIPAFSENRKQLFNGKNLEGWKFVPRTEGDGFSASGGPIQTGGAKGMLLYAGEKIGNATIRIVYKMSNSRGTRGYSSASP